MTFNRWFQCNISWDSRCYRKRGIITLAMLAIFAVQLTYACSWLLRPKGRPTSWIAADYRLILTSPELLRAFCVRDVCLQFPSWITFPIDGSVRIGAWNPKQQWDAVNGISDSDHRWFAHNPCGACPLPTHLSCSSLLAVCWCCNFLCSSSRSLFTLAVQSLSMDWEKFQSVLQGWLKCYLGV